MPRKSPLVPPDAYEAFLTELKARIRTAQVRAAISVNQELVMLYWQIGQEILQRQQTDGWGSNVIGRLAKDLKREFPNMKGLSARNLGYMKSFAEAWPEESILQQAAAKIPWFHNCVLLEKVKDSEERLWYVQQTVVNGWSRNVLTLQIESDLYQRQGGAVTNFERTLPKPQSDLARQILKDPYHLDFLPLGKAVQERDLENALMQHIRDFLLELGLGFAFLGSQYPLQIGGEDFYIDLLFYHIHLRCFVVIELKMGEFKAEYSGKTNLYVAAIDRQLRKEHDNPTIGIILCKSKNRTIVEYALDNINNPIAVATHKLPQELKTQMPTPEQLEVELDAAVQKIEGSGLNE